MSYAFNADEQLYIGGSEEDYKALVCEPDDSDDDECDANDPEPSFDDESIVVANSIPTAAADLNFGDPLAYKD